MIAKALAKKQTFNKVKKDTQLGIDSLKIAAKVRLFWESTKEKGKFLPFSYKEQAQQSG